MKRTTIYLPDEMHLALRREALEKQVTLAELIRVMGDFYLNRADLFWHTIEEMRRRNSDKKLEEVEADILEVVGEIRRIKQGKKG